MCHLILDNQRTNPLFYSPIPEHAQNILDVGTGSGIWARDVGDKYPSAVVTGVDLYPPPETWIPPNCKFEGTHLSDSFRMFYAYFFEKSMMFSSHGRSPSGLT